MNVVFLLSLIQVIAITKGKLYCIIVISVSDQCRRVVGRPAEAEDCCEAS